MASVNINSVTLTGNLTADPELRTLESGTKVATFRIAVNPMFAGEGKKERPASFFTIETWGKLAENVAQYLVKGRKVAVDGRLDQQRWEDKNGGGNRERVQIVAQQVEFLTPSNGNGQSAASAGADEAPASESKDDIPF